MRREKKVRPQPSSCYLSDLRSGLRVCQKSFKFVSSFRFFHIHGNMSQNLLQNNFAARTMVLH